MEIKRFVCGLCTKKRFVSTRFGLRKHLREEHRILTALTNTGGAKSSKQNWWIEEKW